MDSALAHMTPPTGYIQLLFDEELNWYLLDIYGKRLRIYGTVSDLKSPVAVNLISRYIGLPPKEVQNSIVAITGKHSRTYKSLSRLLPTESPEIKALAVQMTDGKNFRSIYRTDLELLAAQEGEQKEEKVAVAKQILRIKKSRFLAITLKRDGDNDGSQQDRV